MRKVRVVPAILTDDVTALKKMADQIREAVTWAQVDIMDGGFVPSKSIGWQAAKAAELPFAWEVHLMVKDPETWFSDFKFAGASRVIFHFEAAPEPRCVIESARKLGLDVGMAINPETSVATVAEFLPLLDNVLLMSVNPGFYGAKFIPEVLQKISQIRALLPNISISIDGGIKEANLLEVVSSGVDDICVGSAVFCTPDPAESYRRLQSMVDAATC
ncbi:ribulose-phosphate 3-epimerase [Dehalogenimonas sp. THU2]|uniref:ribulose-phosphate 3-epimerase n=1 Tax=Dehalogenimonas sp. THU2 TaxID=3151121 RepID=UPI0032182339